MKSSATRAAGDTCDSAAESPRFRTTFTRAAGTKWNDDGGFTDLAMSITEIPSFTAVASATGSVGSPTPQVPAGSQAGITVTVTNTGGTPLTGFQIASDSSVAAVSAPASSAVVAPGGTLQLQTTRTVPKGAHTFTLQVTATAVDANGANLGITTAPQTASLQLIGVEAGTGANASSTANGSANAGGSANGSADSSGAASAGSAANGSAGSGSNGAGAGANGTRDPLAQTGAPADGFALPAAGLLLLAGAAALIGRARLRSRSRG